MTYLEGVLALLKEYPTFLDIFVRYYLELAKFALSILNVM